MTRRGAFVRRTPACLLSLLCFLPASLHANELATGEPRLPKGLGGASRETAAQRDTPVPRFPIDIAGFAELRSGLRTRNDRGESDFSLGEMRTQVDLDKSWDRLVSRIRFDLVYDAVASSHRVDLESGDGFFDLREAFVDVRVTSFLDVKVGRQILTWGTGDLVFINDLFPKDWVSFFLGRDIAYLKAPSDALKASLAAPGFTLDAVYTPRFDADRYVDGERLSYFNPLIGARAGRSSVLATDQPGRWFRDDEIAVRVYRSLGAFEVAGYGYWGFWKSPAGVDLGQGRAVFPRLGVVGLSARGPLAGGIASTEAGLYLSADDSGGSDPGIRNGDFRFMAAYEREGWRDFSLGLQYYLERMSNYGAYRRSLAPGSTVRDHNRHLLTLRLTQLLLQQNLRLSLFAYWLPSERDAYLRSRIHYQIDDHWSTEAGGNLFLGKRGDTFFGQFQRNSNLYLALRYGF